MDTTPTPAAHPPASTARSTLDRLLGQGRDLAREAEDAAAARLGVGDDPAARAGLRQAGLAGGGGARAPRGADGRPAAARGRLGDVAARWAGVARAGRARLRRLVAGGRAAGQRALADLGDEAEAERRATTLLHAMVAAAKADGHVDEEEASAIEAEMEDLPDAARAPDPAAMAMELHARGHRRPRRGRAGGARGLRRLGAPVGPRPPGRGRPPRPPRPGARARRRRGARHRGRRLHAI